MEKKIIELLGIKKYYKSEQSVVMGLNGISMSLSRGEFVAITGESGSGKSTLANVIGGVLPYEEGELFYSGKPTSHFDAVDWEKYRRENISFISQNYDVLPGASVMTNVVSALILSGVDKREAKVAAESILREVELYDIKKRRAANLSSGQKQRLSIARALAKPSPILIADEPTGNLDAENSAKVIELLARVSRDRLVLLVTHDFPEAENLATRHIVLSDGQIVSDTSLRPASEPGTITVPERRKKSRIGFYAAKLEMSSRPFWSAVVGIMFALTAFAVFAFLGVFIINIDDTSTYIYDPSVFANGDKTRIVVSTVSGEPMTDEDYDRLLSVKYVDRLEPNDYISDVKYAYREGYDYTVVYRDESVDDIFGFIYDFKFHYKMLDGASFMRSNTMYPDGRGAIIEGRAPEDFYEITAEAGEAEIGDTIEVFFSDSNHWGVETTVNYDMTVVGITEKGTGLSFSEDFSLLFSNIAKSENSGNMYIPDASLKKGMFVCHKSLADIYRADSVNSRDPDAPIEIKATFPAYDPESFGSDTIMLTWDRNGYGDGAHDFVRFPNLYVVSPEDYHILAGGGAESPQVSVYIEDYAYTDRVLGEVHALGYVAASPFRIGNTIPDQELAGERIHTLEICLTALVVVIVLQILLLTAMFSVQRDSIRILSGIGLSSRAAGASVFWQILIFTAIGQTVGGIAIWSCGQLGVGRIVEMLRYLPPEYILLLSVVHLCAAVIAGAFIVRGIGKHVYPMASRRRDLIIAEEDQEEKKVEKQTDVKA